MGLYKRKNVWWFSVMHNGRRIQETLGTENKKLAERFYAKVVTDLQEGRWFDNQTKKRLLKDMVERFDKEYSEVKDYYQKARDKSIFKNIISFLGEDCTLEAVEQRIGGYELHRRAQGAKPGTILKELGLLRRMFNVARKQWKWKIDNPVSEIELPKVNNGRIRYLSRKEYEGLFNAFTATEDQWLKPFVIIALETGLRLTNLCNLLWSEVNLFNRMIIIKAEKMKNRDYFGTPLTELAVTTLNELQRVRSLTDHVFHDNGENLYDRKVQRAFKMVLKAAEIEDFHFHDLRHTFASLHVQSGTNLYVLQKLLGHKDTRMTQRYAHLSADYLRDAVTRLNGSVTNLLHGAEKEAGFFS